MKVTTGDVSQDGVVYTMQNVHATNGGIALTLQLALGPKIVYVFTQESSGGGSYINNGKVRLLNNTRVQVGFDLTLSSAPAISPDSTLVEFLGSSAR